MSIIVEKIVTIEEQIACIQSKLTTLISKVDTLNRKINKFSDLLAEITAESNAIWQEIDSTQHGLKLIQTLLVKVKTESKQISVDQDENKLLYESMTEMFGEAFQVVSRFFETVQKIGIVDKEKAADFLALQQQIHQTQPMSEPIKSLELPTVPESLQASEIVGEDSDSSDEATELSDKNNFETNWDKPDSNYVSENTKPVIPEFSDIPELPDSLPSMGNTEPEINVLATATEIPVEAEALNLLPLQLTTPINNLDNSKQTELSAEEEKKLEDLLADLSTPIST
ncbi:MAG: hypothetical protein LBI18_15720 [Planctomycetaceae bacterium]|jgi:hypothetical protein|nr:hypothetical protein [Planctomycetaceae bacterium]